MAIAARAGSVNPQNPVEQIASIESSEPYLSSLAAPEVKEFGSLKEVASYWSTKYGVSEKVISSVIHCESSWNPKIYGDGTKAFGLAQFHKPTWAYFNKLRGTDLDYYNPEHQIELMAWAFSEGLAFHWTCFTKLYGN